MGAISLYKQTNERLLDSGSLWQRLDYTNMQYYTIHTYSGTKITANDL